MSKSARSHDRPLWLRVRMIANSRAHRAMQAQTLKLPTNLCPQVDEKFAAVKRGELSIDCLRSWLGQVHTDYVNALEQAHVGWIKTRVRLWLKRRKRAKPQTREKTNRR